VLHSDLVIILHETPKWCIDEMLRLMPFDPHPQALELSWGGEGGEGGGEVTGYTCSNTIRTHARALLCDGHVKKMVGGLNETKPKTTIFQGAPFYPHVGVVAKWLFARFFALPGHTSLDQTFASGNSGRVVPDCFLFRWHVEQLRWCLSHPNSPRILFPLQ
jgi:hypothetical protein